MKLTKALLSAVSLLVFLLSPHVSYAVIHNIDNVNGKPLPVATTVIVLNKDNQKVAEKKTDEKGVLLLDLPEGDYTLQTENGETLGKVVLTLLKQAGEVVSKVVTGCRKGATLLTSPTRFTIPAGESMGKKAGDFMMGAMGMQNNPMGQYSGRNKGVIERPDGNWFTSALDDDNEIEVSVRSYPNKKEKGDKVYVGVNVTDSPDEGGPHMIFLQNIDGEVIRPYKILIFKLWVHWKLTISYWKETYVNGKLVERKITGVEHHEWNDPIADYEKVLEEASIWENLQLHPFGKLQGILAIFKLPNGFVPENWTLIVHVTAKDPKNPDSEMGLTRPYVIDLGPSAPVSDGLFGGFGSKTVEGMRDYSGTIVQRSLFERSIGCP